MRRFVGKFVGTVLGFAVAGVSGAIFGLTIGALHDARNEGPVPRRSHVLENDLFPDFSMNKEQRTTFSLGVIVLGAKLAKIDGHVSREEVLAFRRAFRSPDSQLAEVGRLFDEARTSSIGYEPYAAKIAHVFQRQPAILEEILAGLFYIAIADSPRLSRGELLFLRRIAVMFSFSETDFQRIAARVGLQLRSSPPPPKHDSAYDVLGLPTTATVKEIKHTYHALIRKYHPDKLVAAGLAPQKIAEATEMMKRINAAYTDVCKLRNIK